MPGEGGGGALRGASPVQFLVEASRRIAVWREGGVSCLPYPPDPSLPVRLATPSPPDPQSPSISPLQSSVLPPSPGPPHPPLRGVGHPAI